MGSELTGNKPGRPKATYSRRRWQIAVAALNRVLKKENISSVVVLRAVELLCFINHGGAIPGGIDKRDRKAVKSLVLEHNLERALKTQIDTDMEEQKRQDQERADAEALEANRRLFEMVLNARDEVEHGGDDE